MPPKCTIETIIHSRFSDWFSHLRTPRTSEDVVDYHLEGKALSYRLPLELNGIVKIISHYRFLYVIKDGFYHQKKSSRMGRGTHA
jgi:hypothetical protein